MKLSNGWLAANEVEAETDGPRRFLLNSGGDAFALTIERVPDAAPFAGELPGGDCRPEDGECLDVIWAAFAGSVRHGEGSGCRCGLCQKERGEELWDRAVENQGRGR